MQPNIRPQIMLNWVETVAATVYSQIKFVRREAPDQILFRYGGKRPEKTEHSVIEV